MWTLRRRGGGEREGELGADFNFNSLPRFSRNAVMRSLVRVPIQFTTRLPKVACRCNLMVGASLPVLPH